MPIDTSMYANMQAPDFIGGYEKGLRLSDLVQQRKLNEEKVAKEKAIKDTFKRNVDESGALNQSATLADLNKQGYGQEAIGFQKEFTSADRANLDLRTAQSKKKSDDLALIANLAGSAIDQNSYSRVRNQVVSMGLVNPGDLPEQYDPNLVRHYQTIALTQKDRVDKELKEKEIALKEKELLSKQGELKAKNAVEFGKTATELRKERSGLPTTKATAEVSAAYNKIQSAAKNPTAAGDLSLIFSYMKILDPGSTVREGEFATAQNAAGVPEQIRNIYSRILNGERLSPIQRADFVGQAHGVYQSQLDIQRQVDAQYGTLARKSGIDPADVLLNFEANAPGDGGGAGNGKSQKGASSGWGLDAANASQATPIPKQGTVEDGFVFLGGDPSDPRRWKKKGK